MEEDIKVLEEFIEQYNASYPEEREWVAIYPNQIQAIENLIARNKELEEKNKKLESRKYMLNAETGEVTAIPIDNNYIPKSKIKELINKRGNNGYTSLDCIEDIEELLEERN